ncbi:hypothetical protein NLX83_36475 [Allokutzneria sp. A3M-2-11 16]|uniref:hypothetical protein n=1 Tax=Allokutzneria sp. A3M-2-11 16 TaxID=2962043 RepID=UPI0020B66166|nr:hypothetical protein [Allokutzneria sp. A3M-2-11 16]MCP3804776.1 hypothetical protein [Allokutzneria sp. A3M-2-11 16]
MRALVLDCTLDGRSEHAVCSDLRSWGVNVDCLPATDVPVSVEEYSVLVVLTPSWLGQPSRLAQRVLSQLPSANRTTVAGVVALSELAEGQWMRTTLSWHLWNLGYTVPVRPTAAYFVRTAIQARRNRALTATG